MNAFDTHKESQVSVYLNLPIIELLLIYFVRHLKTELKYITYIFSLPNKYGSGKYYHSIINRLHLSYI